MRERLEKEIKKVFGEEACLMDITKPNEKSVVAILKRESYGGFTIPVDEPLKDLENGETTVQEIVCWLLIQAQNLPKFDENLIKEMLDLPDINKVRFQLINTKENEEYLKTVKHVDTDLGLSIIYRYIMDDVHSFVIPNNFDIDVSKVVDKSKYRIRGMMETLNVLGHPIDEDLEEMMWVVTNEDGLFGAAALLHPELFEEFEEDLFIIPSSIHELIITKTNGIPANEIALMIQEVSKEAVEARERLSNRPFMYVHSVKKIVAV